MGFLESINRAFFTLTYNQQANQAYDEQNAKAAGAVEDLRRIIQGYRATREKIIGAGESTEYFTSNSLLRITEWEKWLEANAGLAAGDYSKKETEMKVQWESLLNVNPIVKEMSRVSKFIGLYLKDKGTKIPSDQRKQLVALESDAEAYYSTIIKRSPPDILAKRDTFAKRFDQIQKEIPETFVDLQEPYENVPEAPANLIQGINDARFRDYEAQVEKKELAEQNTFKFKRLWTNSTEFAQKGFWKVWPFTMGTIFAMIVANDAIGRPWFYRLYFFCFTFFLCTVGSIPIFGFAQSIFVIYSYAIQALLFVYYLYRAIMAFVSSTDGAVDWMSIPILFTFLPLSERNPDEEMPFYKYFYKYDGTLYGGLAKKKQDAYEVQSAAMVGLLNPTV